MQFFSNPEYFYIWLIASSLAVGYFETINYWYWAAIGVFNLCVGILAVGSVVRVVDRAMMSLGLGFEKTGYGLPTWIVRGARPFQQETIRVKSAGFAASDFEKHLDQISSRLCLPIETVRKLSPAVPIIEFVTKNARAPNTLDYTSLKLEDLKPGEFYVGLDGVKMVRKFLADLPHMITAGQTGSGKTNFILQLLVTILSRTPWAHICMIDMKGGVDFHAFNGLANFEMFINREDAASCIQSIETIYDARNLYLRKKKLINWSLLSIKELSSDPAMKGLPIGPLLLVFDELAELSWKANTANQGEELQEQLASFTRKCRHAGIHLVFGCQRPDKKVLGMQSKDNCPARICFSVPSVAASNTVLGNMMATTLGGHRGRAVFQLGDNTIVQTPYIRTATIQDMMTQVKERMTRNKYDRRVVQPIQITQIAQGGGHLR
ncbi:FtsK/SpoIIIE domain-containing protein [Bdellovibrionota bacterium FG-1]